MFARLCSRLSTLRSILKYCVSFWSMSTQLFLRLTSASTARNRAVLEHVRTSSLHILVGKENWQWSWLVAGILLGLDSLQRKQLKCFCMSILLFLPDPCPRPPKETQYCPPHPTPMRGVASTTWSSPKERHHCPTPPHPIPMRGVASTTWSSPKERHHCPTPPHGVAKPCVHWQIWHKNRRALGQWWRSFGLDHGVDATPRIGVGWGGVGQWWRSFGLDHVVDATPRIGVGWGGAVMTFLWTWSRCWIPQSNLHAKHLYIHIFISVCICVYIYIYT